LRARTVANLAVRGRVTPLPSQGDALLPRSFLPPRCFAPAVRINDPYYWPTEADVEYTPPPLANFRYATLVSALSTPIVTPAVIRPRIFTPPLVPPPGVPTISREGRSAPLWHPKGATANAASTRGTPPMTEAEPVRKLRRPPGGPQSSREQEISAVSFTPTTDRPTDVFCACTAAVSWLSAIPHLISVTVEQPGSSLTRISASNVVPRDPRDQSRPHGGVTDLALPHFALRQPTRSHPRALECGDLGVTKISQGTDGRMSDRGRDNKWNSGSRCWDANNDGHSYRGHRSSSRSFS